MKETIMTETEVTTEATETTEARETIPAGCTDNKNSMDPATSTDSIVEALRELNRHAENIEDMLARIIQDLEQPWRH